MVTCRAGREVRPWGSRAGPAGRVPGGRGARLPAQPRVSGSSMATRRRRSRHRATRSRPTFKSKWLKPQGLGGKRDPRSQVQPEDCSPHGNPGDCERSGAPFPAWKGLRRRKGSQGCSWGGGGVQPRMVRGRRENNAQTGVASVAPPHYCHWGSRPVGGGKGDHLTKASRDWEEGERNPRVSARG